MPHAKFDDRFAEHPKIAGLSDGAFRLHVAGILYCSRLRTDGLIDADEVPRLVRRYRRRALDELIVKGVWHERLTINAYEIHDYLEWNDSREQIEARREQARKNAVKRWGQAMQFAIRPAMHTAVRTALRSALRTVHSGMFARAMLTYTYTAGIYSPIHTTVAQAGTRPRDAMDGK